MNNKIIFKYIFKRGKYTLPVKLLLLDSLLEYTEKEMSFYYQRA